MLGAARAPPNRVPTVRITRSAQPAAASHAPLPWQNARNPAPSTTSARAERSAKVFSSSAAKSLSCGARRSTRLDGAAPVYVLGKAPAAASSPQVRFQSLEQPRKTGTRRPTVEIQQLLRARRVLARRGAARDRRGVVRLDLLLHEDPGRRGRRSGRRTPSGPAGRRHERIAASRPSSVISSRSETRRSAPPSSTATGAASAGTPAKPDPPPPSPAAPGAAGPAPPPAPAPLAPTPSGGGTTTRTRALTSCLKVDGDARSPRGKSSRAVSRRALR